MNEEQEKKIELYHEEIEEILGTPPPVMVRAGSGTLLLIFVLLISGSALFPSEDKVQVRAELNGIKPLSVITASQTGSIEKLHNESYIHHGDTLLSIVSNEETLPLIAEFSGILDLNPMFQIKNYIKAKDTIAFIWPSDRDTITCIIGLSNRLGKDVRVGNKVRIVVDDFPVEQYGIFNSTVHFISFFNNEFQIFANLPFDMITSNGHFLNVKGLHYATVDIIIDEKTVFHRLVNPFRGLVKK